MNFHLLNVLLKKSHWFVKKTNDEKETYFCSVLWKKLKPKQSVYQLYAASYHYESDYFLLLGFITLFQAKCNLKKLNRKNVKLFLLITAGFIGLLVYNCSSKLCICGYYYDPFHITDHLEYLLLQKVLGWYWRFFMVIINNQFTLSFNSLRVFTAT